MASTSLTERMPAGAGGERRHAAGDADFEPAPVGALNSGMASFSLILSSLHRNRCNRRGGG